MDQGTEKAEKAIAAIKASFTVDAMRRAGVDLTKAGKNLPKYGIPVTREEFDKAYMENSLGEGLTLKPSVVSNVAKLAENKIKQNAATDRVATFIKTIVPEITNELHNRGTDPSAYINLISKIALAPADIDISKLDPRLTDDERKMVVTIQAISTKLTDGRLQSKPEDAPTTEWANRIRAQQAAAQGKANGVA